MSSSSSFIITPVITNGIATLSFWGVCGSAPDAGRSAVVGINTNTGAAYPVTGSSSGGAAYLLSSSAFGIGAARNSFQYSYTGTYTGDVRVAIYNLTDQSFYIDDIVITAASAASPVLTAAAAPNNTVDADFNITYTDNPTWRGAITAVKVGANTLPGAAWSTSAGVLTLKPSQSAFLQTAGTFTITVLSAGFTDASVSQAIAPGAVTHMTVSVQPGSPASNGGLLNPQPSVILQDQYNNLTTSTASISAEVGAGTWTLGGTTPINAISGTAAFTGLTATSAASVLGATIIFKSTGLSDLPSAPFNIPAPAGLTPPTLTAAVGATVDADFNITFAEDAAWRGQVTGVSVNSNPLPGAAFDITNAGILTLKPSQSSFLQSSGSKTIIVSANGYDDAPVVQSIGAGVATQLVVATQPLGPSTNGGNLTQQPVVNFKDQYNNTTTNGAGMVNAATSGGSWNLSGTPSANGASGTATFNGLGASTAGAALNTATITFTSGSFSVISNSFIIPAYASAATDDYRSNGTGGGTWSSALSWQSKPVAGSFWFAASASPGATANSILIRNGDAITTGSVSANNLTVNGTLTNTGTLTLSGSNTVTGAGSIYEHNQSNVAPPAFTWGSGSTLKLTGSGFSGDVTIANGSYQNIWVAASVNASNFLRIINTGGVTVAGQLKVTATAPGVVLISSISANTTGLTVASYEQSGGTVLVNRDAGTGGANTRALTVTGDVNVSGGTLDLKQGTGNSTTGQLNVGGNVKISGTGILTKSGTGTGLIVFTKSGTQTLENTATVSGVINTTVNAGSNVSLNSNYTISGALSLAGTITIGTHTLTLNGAITGAGTLTGSSTSNLTISGTAGALNFTGGSQILKDLSLATNASASLNTALAITGGSSPGTLTVANGATLTTGGNLTLKSDANGTASIGTSAGAISGDVTVERYIPAKRAWRLLTIPVISGTKTVRDAWANHAPNGNSPAGEVAGSGTNITGTAYGTGAAATAAGFDWWASIANTASSIRRYIITGSSGDWPAYSDNNPINVPGTLLNAAEQGYMVFVRGDRTVTTGVGATTLRPSGTLKTGTQSYSIPAPGTAAYKVIGNPYAATISFETLMANGINSTRARNNRFWIWDANNGSTGGYRLVNKLGAGNWERIPAALSETPPTYAEFIRSGQAFLLETLTAGTNDFTIDEGDKGTPAGTPPAVFDVTNTGRFYANLNLDNGAGNLLLTDGIGATFDAAGKNAIDGDDASKIDNFNENISLVRNGKRLTLEARELITDKDTLFFQVSRLTPRNYALQFKGVKMQAGLTAVLQDTYLSKESNISTMDDAVTTYNFTVSSDAASAAAQRFRVVFKADPSLPLALTSAKAYSLNNGVQVDWKTVNERGLRSYEVEKSIDGHSFGKATTVAATGAGSYGWYDAAPVKGNNYYRIRGIGTNGDATYSQVLMVNLNSGKSAFSIYPNPVKGGIVGVQFSNMEKGKYSMVVFNSAGQKVTSRDINHLGGSATEEINLGVMASGVYRVSLISNGGSIQNQTLVIQK